MHKARIMINAMALEVKKLKYESCADHILLFIHLWIFAQKTWSLLVSMKLNMTGRIMHAL